MKSVCLLWILLTHMDLAVRHAPTPTVA
jgi:hypothetical protein